jgi:catechol 2,3-dioxygenase-like lactoylglutathione lyase family enzyme
MKRVTGIGGIFFKAKDPDALREWYRKHLGIEAESWGFHFQWSDDPQKDGGTTVWSVFADSSKYFDRPFMINYRVENLDELLNQLRTEGIDIDPKSGEPSEFGKFGWVTDPEGNRVELWEPPAK